VVLVIEKPGVIIAAFGITGVLNTLISPPLYAIAGMFTETGAFTNAVQNGTGAAGILTVIAEVVIRVLFLVTSQKSASDVNDYTFKIFTGLMIAVNAVAMGVYAWVTRRVPACRNRIHNAESARLSDRAGSVVDCDRVRLLRQIAWQLRFPAIAQFWIFYVSLTLWPGIPCATGRRHWFLTVAGERGGDWLCSPFIIGAYNLGDVTGRIVTPFFVWMSMRQCFGFSILRTALVPLVVVCVRPHWIDSNWVVVATILVIGLSNGLLCTVSMRHGPMMVSRPELGALIMVLALYSGIGLGAITAAIINKKGWPGEGLT